MSNDDDKFKVLGLLLSPPRHLLYQIRPSITSTTFCMPPSLFLFFVSLSQIIVRSNPDSFKLGQAVLGPPLPPTPLGLTVDILMSIDLYFLSLSLGSSHELHMTAQSDVVRQVPLTSAQAPRCEGY
jgi:hypothetical protein